ncbi:hypothetical protein [Paenibacillus rigui]|uniref:Uncharacterized protein n=1 Tax=Paenibacillus rigui TaxID=554312 RepID=A0A229UQG9_9BACL|nr:hypothetical protein [Paenibacillus rigui]OXM85541.1 hypothetical protein CF651_14200 [Paenibacillus rigui]
MEQTYSSIRGPEGTNQAPVLTVKQWIVTLIVLAIPLVNLIMLFVWAFGDGTNPNKKNYAQASLLLAAIFIVLYIVFLILIFAVFGLSGISQYSFD